MVESLIERHRFRILTAGNRRVGLSVGDVGPVTAGEELDRVEARQFGHLVSMWLTQSFHMLALYDRGLITEDEVRGAFRGLRLYAQRGRYREIVETISDDRLRGLVLDPDGLDKWLNIEH